MKKILLGALALAAAQVASAAMVTVNGSFTATNWTLYFGSPAAPLDPLFLQYSVTFDDTVAYTDDASVLTVLDTNIPYDFAFSHGVGDPSFVLATAGSPGSCTHTPASFCAFVSDFSAGVPWFVEQSPPGGGGWRAQTITAGIPGGGDVPEPPMWALLGVLGIAATLARRQRKTAV